MPQAVELRRLQHSGQRTCDFHPVFGDHHPSRKLVRELTIAGRARKIGSPIAGRYKGQGISGVLLVERPETVASAALRGVPQFQAGLLNDTNGCLEVEGPVFGPGGERVRAAACRAHQPYLGVDGGKGGLVVAVRAVDADLLAEDDLGTVRMHSRSLWREIAAGVRGHPTLPRGS